MIKNYFLITICAIFTGNLFGHLPNYVPTNGLLSFYELDGTLGDLGPSNIPLSYGVSSPTYQADRANNSNAALLFNQGIGATGTTSTAHRPSAYTISAWVFPTVSQGSNVFPILFGTRSQSAVLNTAVFYLANGLDINFNYSTSAGNNVNINLNTTLTLNNWTHLAATFNNNDTLIIYVNGVETARSNSAGTGAVYNANTRLSLANYPGGTSFTNSAFFGAMDEVGFWDRALAPSEIALVSSTQLPCFTSPLSVNAQGAACQGVLLDLNANFSVRPSDTLTSISWLRNGQAVDPMDVLGDGTNQISFIAGASSTGLYTAVVNTSCGVDSASFDVQLAGNITIGNLTAYYPLNGNAGDSSGNGYHATLVSATATTNRFNEANSAMQFGVGSASVQIPGANATALFGNGQNKSISTWFKRNGTGMILHYGNNANTAFNPLAYIGNDGVLRGTLFTSSGNPIWTSIDPIDTNWHNLILTYGTNEQSAYLDGQLLGTIFGAFNPGSSDIITIGNGYAATAYPGVSANGMQPFNGRIDEVRIYDKVLTAAERQQLYNDGSQLFFTQQPEVPCIYPGQSTTLEVDFEGNANLQWFKNGSAVFNQNAKQLTLTNIQPADYGDYTAQITNRCFPSFTKTSKVAEVKPAAAIPQPVRVYPLDLATRTQNIFLQGTMHGDNGSTSGFVPDRFGNANSARSMSGNSAAVTNLSPFRDSTATVTFWANFSGLTSPAIVFSHNSNNAPYHIRVATNGNLTFQTTSALVNTGYTVPQGWVHMAVVYNNNINIFYVEGVEVFRTNNGINLGLVSNSIGNIGIENASNGNFLLDDVRFYGEVFTEAQVRTARADTAEAPYFVNGNLHQAVCVGQEAEFSFSKSNSTSAVSVFFNQQDILGVTSGATVTDSSFTLPVSSASEFGEYEIELRDLCSAVRRKVIIDSVAQGSENVGLLGYYTLDSTLANAIGGNPIGSVQSYGTGVYGDANGAYNKINGIPTLSPALPSSGAFTFNMWVNANHNNSWYYSNDPQSVFIEGLRTDAQGRWSLVQASNFSAVSNKPATSGWRMVTWTFDGATHRVYENAEKVIELNNPSRFINQPMSILWDRLGLIDEVRTYNRAISDLEVDALYKLLKVVESPESVSACTGQTVVLTAKGASMGTEPNYQWYKDGTAITLFNSTNKAGFESDSLVIFNVTLNDTGSYYCVISTACKADTTDVANLSIGVSNVTVTLPVSADTLCFGDVATYTATATGPVTGYQWYENNQPISGETASAYTMPLAFQNVNLSVEVLGGSCGPVMSAPLNITVNQSPFIGIISNATTNCFGDTITLTANGANTYLWSTGDSGISLEFVLTADTSFTVVGYDAAGCYGADMQQFFVNPLPDATITGDTVLCFNDFEILSAPAGMVSYQWSNFNNVSTSAISGLTVGTEIYSVTVTDQNGCVNSDSILVETRPDPVVGFTGDVVLCPGESSLLVATGADNYSWFSYNAGVVLQSPQLNVPSVTDTFQLSGTDAFGCSGDTTFVVQSVPNPFVQITSNKAACLGDTILLTATGASQYLWSTKATPTGPTEVQLITAPYQSYQFFVEGTDTNGCVSTDTINITSGIYPNVQVSGDSTFCDSVGVVLGATDGGLLGSTYLWNTGDTTDMISVIPTAPTVYTVTVSNFGCEGNAQITVSPIAKPIINVSVSDTVVCQGDFVTFQASGANNFIASFEDPWDGTARTIQVSSSEYRFIGREGTCLSDTTVIAINRIAPAVNRINETICSGDFYSFGGQLLNQSGRYFDTIPGISAQGCDSIVDLTLTVFAQSSSTLNASICQGEVYDFGSFVLTTSGVYTERYTNALGCDSLVTLTLQVNPTDYLELQENACDGDTVFFAGVALTNDTTLRDNLTNIYGCDSVVQLQIWFNRVPTPTITSMDSLLTTEDDEDTYQWFLNGQPISGATSSRHIATQSGIYTVASTSIAGCTGLSPEFSFFLAGLANTFNQSISIYPNPADERLTIAGFREQTTLSLYSIEGKLVYQSQVVDAIHQLDVGGLEPGMYLLTLKSAHDSFHQSIIVK